MKRSPRSGLRPVLLAALLALGALTAGCMGPWWWGPGWGHHGGYGYGCTWVDRPASGRYAPWPEPAARHRWGSRAVRETGP